MAALEVRRAGFPTRIQYREFVREFRAFTPRGGRHYTDDKELTAKMMAHPHVNERVKPSAYRLGVSKLFLQAEILYELQSVKNAMLYPFVRRLQRWWVHLQGSILQRKLKRCIADLTEAMKDASINAVSAVPYVVEAIQFGEDAKTKATTAVSANAIGGAAGPAVEAIAAFRKVADNAKKIVAAAIAQKEEAYRIRASLLSEIDTGNERCTAIKDVATSLYDPKDRDHLKKSALGAEEALAKCRAELLTVANMWESATLAHTSEQGPHTLRRAGTKANLMTSPPQKENSMTAEEANAQRRKKLDDALALVRQAETLSLTMLEKKRAMDEARAEFQGQLDLASERLSAIQVDVFIIAGITSVSKAVAAAREEIYGAQKALQAIDPDPVKAAVDAATAAVESAITIAQHEAARVAAMVTLDESEKTLNHIQYEAQAAGLDQTLTQSVALANDAITTARDACNYPDVHVLQTSTARAVDAVNGCGVLLEREAAKKRAEEKERFRGRLDYWSARENKTQTVPSFARRGGAPGGGHQPQKSVDLGVRKTRRVPATTADANVSGVGSTSDDAETSSAKFVVQKAEPFSGVNLPERSETPPTPTQSRAAGSRVEPPPPAAADPPSTPASTNGAASTSMTLDEWIEHTKMTKYQTQIKDLAADVDDLLEMSDDDVEQLIQETGMAKMVVRRFKRGLIEIGAKVTPV